VSNIEHFNQVIFFSLYNHKLKHSHFSLRPFPQFSGNIYIEREREEEEEEESWSLRLFDCFAVRAMHVDVLLMVKTA
jgi:hypothetical protein